MIKAVIFDLDGVIVTTDEYHYQAWKKIAEENNIYFDRAINERLRGVSRMESLDIMLEKATEQYTNEQKQAMAQSKNDFYRELLKQLTEKDILPGVDVLLDQLVEKNIKIAIGSSSKNTPTILERIGYSEKFEAIADGNQISKSKPDPEVFLLAAQKLNIEPQNCLVVEDAEAGVSAALRGGMKVLAVGTAATDKRAHLVATDLEKVTVDQLLMI